MPNDVTPAPFASAHSTSIKVDEPRTHVAQPSERLAKRRLVQLDALRGVAAVWVMLYHYTVQYAGDFGHQPGAWQVPYGQRAVELFFMISGFVIPMTLERTKRVMDFVVSRLSRLYPTFWACLAITACVVGATQWQGSEASVGDVALNATMVPHLIFHRPYLDRSYWTLEVELLFYVITGLAWGIGGMRAVTAAIIGLTAFSLAESLFLADRSGTVRGVLDSYLLMSFISYFACGFAAFGLREHGLNHQSLLLLTLALAANLSRTGWPNLLTTAALAGVVIAAGRGAARPLAFCPLVFLGSISYPLYLLHQDIGYIAIQYGYAAGLPSNVNIALAIAIALALGTLVSFGIEKPAMRWIRGVYLWHKAPKIEA